MAQETTPYLSAALGSANWKGTSRYQVVGCLGRGGMGAVYEVFDRERQQAVALKTLLHFDPAGLYRFKQEFRTLADVQHPNLVRLYELVVRDGSEIFFTMELVRGGEFTQYTRVVAPASEIIPVLARLQGPGSANGGDTASAPSPRRMKTADESRLRPALCQLVSGVRALHAAGKLHRDIKPSNALVTEEGRVVLLDFGVATELSSRDPESGGASGEMVGTAQYMAPEQAEEGPPTPASDWYSVGVMLYEALVGTPPFVGSTIDVLTMKNTMAAPLPSASVDGVPPDLDALCHALLDVDPQNRPHGDEILRRLGVDRSRSSAPPPLRGPQAAEGDAELVGRADPLRTLAEALGAAQTGQPVTVFVTGPSGIGKTRLVNHFLDELVVHQRAVVLRGRAYEREAVPYKAFDTVMDSLSRHLMTLHDAGHELPLPEDTWLLARLFPVLQRIPALAEIADRPIDDPQTVRRRAFAALRDLLASLSKRSPVVIFVDDVHWGDTDSAALLLELVRPPSAAALMVVMTYQPTKEGSPFLTDVKERWPAEAHQQQLPIAALTLEEARQLAMMLTGAADVMAQRSARAVARESLGQPFLIEELVRANRGYVASSSDRTLGVLSVDQMIGERLQRLSESARMLAEIVAVGGQPLPISVAIRAAGVDPSGTDQLVATVCGRRFARTGLRGGRDVLEPTYDQIRDRVVAQLPEDRLKQHHASLAVALQDAPDRDGEAIAEHWLGAGEPERAATMAREAAEQALAKFAFDQSARLLRLALANTPSSSPDVNAIRVRLAQALQLGGRSTESGRQYLEAVATAPPEQKLELRRAAAEQLLAAGRIQEGEKILHEVLASCGMRAPRSPLVALFWLIFYSIWIHLRGYKFTERAPADVSEKDRMRIEALYTTGICFGFVNSILSICVQKRQCLEALRVGDRFQVLIALATQISHMGNAGPRETDRERALVRTTRDLAKRVGTPLGESYVDMAVGLCMFFRGRWLEARELLERAEVELRHSGNRVIAVNARVFSNFTYFYAGEFSEYWRRTSRQLAEAEDRGDLFSIVTLRASATTRRSLSTGDTGAARKMMRDVMAQWTQTGFSVQHWLALTYGVDLDLYDGDGGRAYDHFMQTMPALKKSLLLGNYYMRIITMEIRGRLAVASIASRPETRNARLAEARKMARLLEREPNAWAAALGSLVKASAELASGDRSAAIAELRRTIALSAASDLGGSEIVARYRLGELLDDDEGRELVRGATEVLRGEWGIKDVERYVNVLFPCDLKGGARAA